MAFGRESDMRPCDLDGIETIEMDRTHGGVKSLDLLDFSASINPLGPPHAALEEYRAAAAAISSYPEPYAERLVERIAEWLGIRSDEVIVGNGSTQLIHLFARVYRTRFPHVAIPTFSEFANAIALNGNIPCALQLDRQNAFTIRLADVKHAIRHGAQAVFIGRPNSPTGSLAPLSVAEEIACECELAEALCVFDEAFIDFSDPAESAIALIRAIPESRRTGLVIIGSLTKIFAIPGLRVGFLAGPSKVIRQLRQHLEPWSVNAIAQRVALACLIDAAEFRRRTREWLRQERAYLQEQLARIGGIHVFPSMANFLMFEVYKGFGNSKFGEFMLQHGIAVRDLSVLPGCSSGLYRVAVRLRADNDHLLAAARAYAEDEQRLR
ncbi:MAG TPA: histidinol-phosphate transaminase [Candidatus Binataceae bacterium]|nr:histidinol-phosphate transaminase [Candidatus Binataceae bacterium]